MFSPLRGRGRWQEADEVLARLMREHPDAAELREARYLAHRARFEHALAIADIEAPQPDEETDYRVTLSNGREVRVRVTNPLPGIDNVLFMTAEHRTLLLGILNRLGGTETRPPRYIMETPNQPIGPSLEILALWKQFFPARPAHWGGWVLQTYPVVVRITFEDEARTRASVAVGIGYSGCTVHLERTDDGWSVVRLSSFWIT